MSLRWYVDLFLPKDLSGKKVYTFHMLATCAESNSLRSLFPKIMETVFSQTPRIGHGSQFPSTRRIWTNSMLSRNFHFVTC